MWRTPFKPTERTLTSSKCKYSASLWQEDTSSQRVLDQQDPSSLASVEVLVPRSPSSQVVEQKDDDSKKEPVDEEWLKPAFIFFPVSIIWFWIKWNRTRINASCFTHVGPFGPVTPRALIEERVEAHWGASDGEEGTVFINCNPAYINGNIQCMYKYIGYKVFRVHQYIVHSKMVLKRLNSSEESLCKRKKNTSPL